MPRFQHSPAAVTANFSVLPAGPYTLKLGEPKTFLNDNSAKNKENSYGIRIGLSVLSPAEAKSMKPAPVNLYQHNEGSQSAAKAFLIAAYGYRNNQDGEAEFNLATANLDWSFDTDTGELGEGWKKLAGMSISCEATVTMYEGNQQNKMKWLPISAS